VFDGDRNVGRTYLVDGYGGRESWFWGVSFQVTKRKRPSQLSSPDHVQPARLDDDTVRQAREKLSFGSGRM
jgi:hypothetical protein